MLTTVMNHNGRIAGIKGGSASNAIPMDCIASVYIPKEERVNFEKDFKDKATAIKAEYVVKDPNM